MSETLVRGPDDGAEADSLKRQLLTRAGMAAALILALLGGLAVYDRVHRGPAPAASPPAAPAVETPAPMAPPALAAPAENPLADGVLRRDTPPEPELSAAPVMVPPGQRHADAPEAARGAPRLVLGGEPDGPPAAPVPKPAPARTVSDSAGPSPATDRPPAAGSGYLVQMGFFGSPENAEALRSQLVALGIPARLESRVVVGPFPDKAAARAAQARLKEAGQAPGLILPPRR